MNFCSKCGQKFLVKDWPRECIECASIFYRTPTPVSIAVVQIQETDGNVGILTMLRGGVEGDPGFGEWALPGGYQEYGESSRQAAARELEQETGIVVSDSSLAYCHSAYALKPNVQLTFWKTPILKPVMLKRFVPNEEALELKIVRFANAPLAFPTHEEVLKMLLPNPVR